jgi:hypothetical protein
VRERESEREGGKQAMHAMAAVNGDDPLSIPKKYSRWKALASAYLRGERYKLPIGHRRESPSLKSNSEIS